MKVIHCSVWGDIEVSDTALKIIDTVHFQRLHYIKQTGFGYKVFPTATSSRFEHSLGVYHVTRLVFHEIEKKQPEVCPDARTQELVCLVGLVHDLGHGPFSHLFDKLAVQQNAGLPWTRHEYRSQWLFRDLVKKYKLPFTENEITFITERIDEPPDKMWYDTLVNNPISSLDTDKMDYVVRDSLHFGMKFHTDIHRILRNMRVIDDRLCFCDRIYDEIQLFFQIRDRMHKTIYRHPKIEYFGNHLMQLLEIHAPDFFINLDLTTFLDLGDRNLIQLVPRDLWIDVEIRSVPPLLLSNEYNDDQWEKARKHLRFFSRKLPTVAFSVAIPS